MSGLFQMSFINATATGPAILYFTNSYTVLSGTTNNPLPSISTDNKFLYTGNDTEVLCYSIDQTTGALTLSSTTAQGGNVVEATTISPDNNYLYVVSAYYSGIFIFSRNITTGVVTATNSGTPSIAGALKMTISPDGTTLYLQSTNGSYQFEAFSRDSTTGNLTSIATYALPSTTPAGGSPISIEVSPDNLFVYVISSTYVFQYSRSLSTGLLTALSTPYVAISGGSMSAYNYGSVKISPDGLFLYVSSPDISQYSRSLTTGLITPLTPAYYTPFVDTNLFNIALVDLCLSPDGLNMYSYLSSYSGFLELTRDSVTGLLSSQVIASYQGYILGTTLTVTSIISGIVDEMQRIQTTNIVQATAINGQTGGSTGGVGTYTVSVSQTLGSATSPVTFTAYNIKSLSTLNPTYAVVSPDGTKVYGTDTSGYLQPYTRH